eukprot:SAG11_NODE_1054_length_6018_cov_2.481250_5_plen_121_part_00
MHSFTSSTRCAARCNSDRCATAAAAAHLYTDVQLFERVEATKPQASRNTSAEIFVVCLNYKNPKIDPRLLDPKFAFEEVTDRRKADVFAKKQPKRNREGYEEGVTSLLHKKSTVSLSFLY